MIALAVELAEKGVKVVLVIDELDNVCRTGSYLDDPRATAGERARRGNLHRIVHRGRHIGRPVGNTSNRWGVTLVGSARRPTNLHADIGELAEQIVYFRMDGRNSLAWVEQTSTEEVALEVAKLPKWKHVTYDPADVSDAGAPAEQ